ncbi:probable G-protein coupled receptor 139 [Rhincodon typus]|uniref:probable G-protein coupled receptor 139 n=1 Tax=Rhincodon typus TaxID=259920 RepID=UPI00202DC4A5|nr:probable G-protein coupled receptor 139 [Rhincodon typus]
MLTANVVTIVILARGKCGLSRCIKLYLLNMAAADLLVLTFDVILYQLNELYFPESFLNYTVAHSLTFFLHFASIECSVWLTVAFTFDRFAAICFQTIRRKYCRQNTAIIFVTMIWGLSILQNLPIYFTFEPCFVIDNISWHCILKSSFYSVPLWVAFLWLDTVLLSFTPFLFILILNFLTIRHILFSNKIRMAMQSSNSDPEMEHRRKSIMLLLLISFSFILLWMVTFIHYICVQITEVQYLHTDNNDPFTIMERTGYMLQDLSSCINTFIYAISQMKFRERLKCIFRHFFVPFRKVFKYI